MPRQSHEVLIAVLGLVGVLVTAVASNGDKWFAKNPIVQAEYSGYKPTENFATELRYFFEVSGSHAMMDSYLKRYIETEKAELLSANPADAAAINRSFDVFWQEFKFDDIVAGFLPVYQKHYTLAEIQALNKFYSTDVMRQMVRQAPLVAEDVIPVQNKLIKEVMARVQERVK